MFKIIFVKLNIVRREIMSTEFKRNKIYRAFYLLRTYIHYHLFFKKKFLSIDKMPAVFGIWNVRIFGPNISLGKNVIIVAPKGIFLWLTTVKYGSREGCIEVGNNVLLMPGIRVSSASKITIKDDCMLSHGCYITDADWHDVYDRTRLGKVEPVVLEKGVWVGDSATICKGVTVGENSIIGAKSVVTKDVPPNTIVAGNPAKVVGNLDKEKVVTMGSYFHKYGNPRI